MESRWRPTTGRPPARSLEVNWRPGTVGQHERKHQRADYDGQQHDPRLHGAFLPIRLPERPGRGDACCSPRTGRCYLLSCRSRLATSWNLQGSGLPSTGSFALSAAPTDTFALSATRLAGKASGTTMSGRSRKPGAQFSRDSGSTPSARRQASRSSSSYTGKAFAPGPARASTSTICRPAARTTAAPGTRAALRATAARPARPPARFSAPSTPAGARAGRDPGSRSV